MPLNKAIIDKLSALDANVTLDAPIGQQSWFRCGGCADLLLEPHNLEALQAALKIIPQDLPVTVIGGLANTIVRDGGVRGVTIRLKKPFSQIELVALDILHVGAGALNGSVASQAAKNAIGGLEFLSGIPGTLGGATFMNAGAYGHEMKDVLQEIHCVNRAGELITLNPVDLNMSYRKGNLPRDMIVVKLSLKGNIEDEATVRQRLKDIKERRNATQPIKENTGGSTFANPFDDMRAWQVVEKVGGRDLTIGGAAMSDKHLNFMINNGDASSCDLEYLGDELVRRAKESLGVDLRWEIKRIGEDAD